MSTRFIAVVRAALAAFFVACAVAPSFAQWQVPDHAIPLGRGAGAQGFKSVVPGAAGNCLVSNGAAADPSFKGCGNLINVMAAPYNALGDGSADDAAAIQAAITAQGTAGGCLYFPTPPSFYKVGTTLNATAGTVSFCAIGDQSGAGPGIISPKVSTIKASFASGDILFIRSPYGPYIANLGFGYTGASPRTGGGAVHVSGPTSPAAYCQYPTYKNLVFEKQYFGRYETNCAGGYDENPYHQNWAHSAIYNDRTDVSIEISLGTILNPQLRGNVPSGGQIAGIHNNSGYLKVIGGGIGGAQVGILNAPVNAGGNVSISQTHIEEQTIAGVSVSAAGGGSLRLFQIANATFTISDGLVVGSATNNVVIDAGVDIKDVQITATGFRNHSSAGTFRPISIGSGQGVIVANNVTEALSGTQVGITIGAGVTAPALVADNLLTVTGGSATKYGVTAATTVVDPQGLTVAQLPVAVANGSRIWATDGNPAAAAATGGSTGAWVERRNGAWVTVVAGTAQVPQGGTGGNLWTLNGVMLGQASSALGVTAAGTNGQVLIGQTGAAPSWNTMSGDCTLAAAGAITCSSLGGVAIGTSGHTIPVNDGNNTHSGTMLFTGATTAVGNATGYTFEVNKSVAGNNIANFNNSSVTGVGARFQNGLDTNYAIAAFNAAGNGPSFAAFGNGNVQFGQAGTLSGNLLVHGVTSGFVTISPQAAAGTPTLILPNASGTFAVSATSPLVRNATTGDLTCPTCGVTGTGLNQFASTTSAQLAGVLSDETGSGAAVFATSPTLVTPVLGVATATTINGVTINNSAWPTYSPTISCGSGTITTLGTVSAAAYTFGKSVWGTVDITITTNGTCAGSLRVTLPSTPNRAATAVGKEQNVTGEGLFGQIAAASTTMTITNTSNVYPGGDGRRAVMTFEYKSQ